MSTVPSLLPHPTDATLTVTRAAHVLGVHPNTIRAWSDAGRVRYYRINPRGDRRYRLTDLNRFLAGAAEGPALDDAPMFPANGRGHRSRGAFAHLPSNVSSSGTAIDTAATLTVMAGLGRVAASIAGAPSDPEAVLGRATLAIRNGAGFEHVSAWQLEGDELHPVGFSGATGGRLRRASAGSGLFASVLAQPGRLIGADRDRAETAPITGVTGRVLACTIPGSAGPWGVLLAVTGAPLPSQATTDLLVAASDILGSIVRAADAATDLDHRVHRAEAIGRVAGDIGSQLDPDQVLVRVVDHALAMFGADRAAVLLFEPDGSRSAVASRGLSAAYLAAVRPMRPGSLSASAIAERRPLFSVGYQDDPRSAATRAQIVQEGFDTACIAPLFEGDSVDALGSLNVYHDRPHQWTDNELDTIGALASQAGVAIRTARAYAQLARWAAQLQSIQQLGARLNRLSDVAEIGAAIATELSQLIDHHNVRVYRKVGDDLIPVAMRGHLGEYVDETPDQLKVKLGHGITGWVAEHRVAQHLPDAAADPRANTIPGTDEIDESMLLAPMLFEDQVLGVLVLSKLGLNQFTDDDLRLLVIYASFAAQAMAHADATLRLQRQVKSQRDLLQITESILTTLDAGSVLESVADRLAELVGWDNVWIELADRETGVIVPVMAKGSSAADYMEPWSPGETGIGPWVMEHNEAVLLGDQYDDPRVRHLETGPVHGGLICVPLRGRGGPMGILTLERLGEGRSFSDEEFDLVKLFAAQVSIAVQNAQAHDLITRQAETDDLTGLRNSRSFRVALDSAVAAGETFSLLMVDLDRFKLVNDTFGHQAGNVLLRQVAEAIVSASRDTDAVFRYGGDEFVVLLPRSDADHVGPVAERIRNTLTAAAGLAPGMLAAGIHIDASAGVATYPTDGDTPAAILLAADRACFMAKRSGGGRVATASEGQALSAEFTLQVPTPIDVGP